MKKVCLALLAFTLVCFMSPAAQARGGVSIGFGCCGGGYGRGYGGGYYPYYYAPYYSPYYGYPSYYAPPPTVIYTEPQPQVTYVTPPPQPQVQAAPDQPPQAAPTFTDKKGRTCRQIETVIDGTPVNGTACLQRDGTWRTVGD